MLPTCRQGKTKTIPALVSIINKADYLLAQTLSFKARERDRAQQRA